MKLSDFKQTIEESKKVNIDNRLNKIDVSPYLKPEETIPTRRFNLKLVYTFASILILFVIGFSINFVNTPVSTLTIDLNPSLEVKINAFNRVLSVESINNDADNFISELNYKNKTIDELLEEIQTTGQSLGYFDSNEGFLLVGVYSKDYEEEAKIVDILEDNTFFSFLTVTQHLDTNQLMLRATQETSYFDSIFNQDESNDYLENANVPSTDYDSGIVTQPIEVDYSGYSEVKLLIVQTLINESFYTQADLLTLLEMPVKDLITEYNNLN